jgi:hypothetical protein
MAFSLTPAAFSAVNQVVKTPNLVVKIDGVDELLGAVSIKKIVQIGDSDLFIGNDWQIGGLGPVANQETIVSFSGGTTTSIKQSLNTDRAEGSTISNIQVAFLDDGFMTKVITPGEIIPDILGTKVSIYLGFDGTSFPGDYLKIFKGICADISSDSGLVTLTITHPENKKRTNIYKTVETRLTAAIDASVTTIPVESTANILTKVLGPNGTYDPSFESYVRIDDEIIKFETVDSTNLLTCLRGQFGTTAAAHDDESQVTTIYRLKGLALPLALKLMASGLTGPFVEDIEIKTFQVIGTEIILQAVFFENVDLVVEYGLTIGDFLSTAGATDSANNFTLREIEDIQVIDQGTYLVVGGSALADETMTSAVASFRSRYDTLPDGCQMGADEIDVDEHELLLSRFLSNEEYDFRLVETIENAREFLDRQIYLPIACFSIPRQTKASVGYTIGPIPGENITTLNSNNIKKASRAKIRRSISAQFFNEVVYKYEQDILNPEKFKSAVINIAQDSKNQIKAGNKTLTIESLGMRDFLSGDNIALQQSNRKLKRYKFAAEVLTLSTLFDAGFSSEIGDIIIVDSSDIPLPDTKSGQKSFGPRFYEIQNKSINFKTGDIELELVDTQDDPTARYALISPSSKIRSASSGSSFVIEESFSAKFDAQEYRKWINIESPSVVVRKNDFSLSEDSVLTTPSSNSVTVDPALSSTPAVGDVLEFSHYDDVDTTASQKLVYGYMRNTDFADGGSTYKML